MAVDFSMLPGVLAPGTGGILWRTWIYRHVAFFSAPHRDVFQLGEVWSEIT